LSDASQEISSLGYPLEVTVRYGNLEKKISGHPQEVARATLTFLMAVVPQLELAARLSMSTDLTELTGACEGVIAVTPEGLVVTVPTDILTDRELLLLHLAKARIAEIAGKSKVETMQSSELIAATKRTAGTVAGRLSELCAENLAERKGKGEYRATTLGLNVFQQTILPKLKQGRGA
jgi:hypothetical protein